ncbi:MAG: DUF3048 domain-containing protein [Lachnospiraceae bacterium]|nr:DUF3048 domain-containing protein [Lachnospiraceae bacterium]
MNLKRTLVTITLFYFCVMAMGCGKKQEKVTKKESPAPKVVTTDEHVGEEKSMLTGLWIDEEVAKQRPLAIMMGNTSDAAPQSGIEKAGVVYEIPVEGGITRLMSVIEDYSDLKRIGSVRSCRYYFVHYAMEYNGFYAHFGQSKYALPTLNNPMVPNVNGLEGEAGKCYYRVTDRRAPHNAFADGSKIKDYLVKKGNDLNYDDSYQGHFTFAEEDEENQLVDGSDATYVSPGYSVDQPWFEYNQGDKLYYRFQYNKEHVDNESGRQLSCKNIVIQYVNIGLFDDGKSLTIGTVGSGKGEFITNGKSVPMVWKKQSEFAKTTYCYEDGTEIEFNPGKTWILLVDAQKTSKVTVK